MLGWFRRQARSASALVLVPLVALTLCSSAPHADDCHGPDCARAVPHDPSQHAVERSEHSSEAPLHCVLCHLPRLARFQEAAFTFAQAAGETFHGWYPASSILTPFSSAQPPLRAPPVTV
jgi:hypothetical protein